MDYSYVFFFRTTDNLKKKQPTSLARRKHLTASWTSPLAGYVWNYISGNEPVAIESVALQAEPSAPSCCRTIAS